MSPVAAPPVVLAGPSGYRRQRRRCGYLGWPRRGVGRLVVLRLVVR